MTLWHDEDTNELVASTGKQEFRLELADHERNTLAQIVDDIRDDVSIDEGDQVTFTDTDREQYDAVVTKVWDEDTINLVHAGEDGALTEVTSVVRQQDSGETYAFSE